MERDGLTKPRLFRQARIVVPTLAFSHALVQRAAAGLELEAEKLRRALAMASMSAEKRREYASELLRGFAASSWPPRLDRP